MKLSVIIVSYNVAPFLGVCLHSVARAARGLEAETIVVDNNSADGSDVLVETEAPHVTLLRNAANEGFAKANNRGVAHATGQYLLFLNPDTVMPEDFLRRLIHFLDAHPEAGAVGPRLIDGRGRFAPDGKKRFPTLWVALTKALGLGKLAPQSPLLNGYYAVHIGPRQTAPVEVLSGCCMAVRRAVLERERGGSGVPIQAFDEDYFMYCEDVDLSWRIRQAGYQNVYFPEVDLLHYKGESTRKSTLNYVRIFNGALATFVRKHYSSGRAGAFIGALRAGIFLRSVLGVVKNFLKALRMPIFDAIVLLIILWVIKEFWVGEVKGIPPISLRLVLLTFPVYTGAWIGALYLAGAYDRPYRPLRVVRGMAVGTAAAFAFFGLLPAELRYSRAIILFSGLSGTVALLLLHEAGRRLGIFPPAAVDDLPAKAVVVGSAESFAAVEALLSAEPSPPGVVGRVDIGEEAGNRVLGPLAALPEILYTTGAGEAIFCAGDADLSYADILRQMQRCGADYEYRIWRPGAVVLVGTSGGVRATDAAARQYPLADPAHRRAKRVVDVGLAVLLLALSPLLVWSQRKPGGFFRHCAQVLWGRRTWVGYARPAAAVEEGLPYLRTGVVPPMNLLAGFVPSAVAQHESDRAYARSHRPGTDLLYIARNFRWLGGV